MRKKILAFLIGMLVGIGLFVNYENLDPIYIIFAGISLSLILLLFERDYLVMGIAIPLGFILCFYNFNQFKLKDYKSKTLELTIVEKRQLDEGYRYFVRAYGDGIDENSLVFSEDNFDIGEVLIADVGIKIPNRNTNPNLFNYRNYLISKSIASELEIQQIKNRDISHDLGLRFKGKFYQYIHKIFEENLSKDASDFLISVILGENLINNSDINDLGLAHILAVSGLHIDILLGFIIWLLTKANVNYRHANLAGLLLCFGYGYLISFPFSVIRVLLVNTISYLAFILKRPEDRVKVLIFAANIILLMNPFAVLNSGFVLSFVATSGVYLIYPIIKKRLPQNELWQSLGFTAAIQTTLLPFIIYYYGMVNLLSLLANFLILPIFTIVAYGVFGIIIIYPLARFLLWPVFKIIDYLVNSILNITSLLNSIDFLKIEFAHPDILLVVYGYLLLLIIVLIKRNNKSLIRNFYKISLLIISISLGIDVINPEVSFSMIDIGQGDTFLLADSGDFYLFDVGGPKYKDYDSGERVLIPYLKSLGIKNIKAIFISHEDADHAGNLHQVYENFNVESLISGKYNTETLSAYNPQTMVLDDEIALKNGSVKCVYEGEAGEENAQSLGLLISIRGVKILTLGDLDKSYEDKLDVSADILKVSHHGSRNSTSKDFVEKVNPKLALISAGRNNTYGHPTKEVIENLDGVKIYNTQNDGLVKIKFGKDVTVEPYLKGGYFRWTIENSWISWWMEKPVVFIWLIQRKIF